MPTTSSVSSIAPEPVYYGENSGNTARIPTQTLGQNDFLKLVVAQMSQQDPLNPKADTEFIAQMAQFSALEQSKTMQQDIAALRGEQQLMQATSLLGRTVEIQTGADTSVFGLVDGVHVQAGKPLVVVDGVGYDLSNVLRVSPTPAPTPTP